MRKHNTGDKQPYQHCSDLLLPCYQVSTCDIHLSSFSTDPYDPELMSEEVRSRIKGGEELPVGKMKIPMVDLPLGATEDRVCGTIDIEKALTEGKTLYFLCLLYFQYLVCYS